MTTLGGERSAVQRPFLRYAVEAGWTYLSPDEALRLRSGGVISPVLDAVLVEQLQRLNPGVVDHRRAEETVKKQIETASRKGQERINRAVAVGEEIKVKSREEAKQEAETLIDRARSEIQHECDEAIQGVRKEFVDLTIMAAEKVIERSLDKEAHRELIEKVLEGEIKKD